MKIFITDSQKQHHLFVAIIAANPGIEIHCSKINEVIKHVFEETGTLISAKPQLDYYESDKRDRNGDPYINNRINRRKFTLTIRHDGSRES